MVDDLTCPWSKDPIPDEDHVFLRILAPTFVDYVGESLRPKPLFFRNTGEVEKRGMSSDWCRHCPDPEATRQRAATEHKPEEYGVIAFDVRNIREFKRGDDRLKQDVKHDPVYHGEDHPLNNQAHAIITGPKTRSDQIAHDDMTEIRNWYALNSRWAILPPEAHLPPKPRM